MKKLHIPFIAGLIAFSATTTTMAQSISVELPGGRKITGTAVRADSSGTVHLTTESGVIPFPKGQYIRVSAPKPAEFNEAMALASSGKHDEAIQKLRAVTLRMRFLAWDIEALKEIARIQLAKGDGMGAIAACDDIAKTDPKAAETPDFLDLYRQALLQAKQFAKLETMLNKAISGENREDSAKAQLLRGDVRAAQGQKEPALLDYLRVVYFYEAIKDVQPEALFKSAQILEEIRDPRAKKWYEKLIREYPASSYAEQAKRK